MSFAFATCERGRALGFLKKLYPSVEVKDEGDVSDVLDFVERDVIRICDPDFHGGTVVPGNNGGHEQAMPALRKMHASLLASRAALSSATSSAAEG